MGTSPSESLAARVEGRVTAFYLESTDFNGIPARQLLRELAVAHDDIKTTLCDLIASERVVAVIDVLNPHIRRLPDRPLDDQIRRVIAAYDADYCLYPSRQVLEATFDRSTFQDRPFTLELALGAPQLEPVFFDLSVLEVYRNDPRYHYETNDISGWLGVRDEHYLSDKMEERDKISLQDFGFGYSEDYDRAVAVYLRYLSDLSPEHQKIWNARRLRGAYTLHPDHYRSTILGEWPERISLFDAFISELQVINEMAVKMGRPPMFRSDFVERPRSFGFLVRPTSKELDDFIHLLDKMLSENLNRDFFVGEVPLEEETERADGKIVVTQIGTIRLLGSWFTKRFRIPDPQPLEAAFSAMKKVRKLRQHPAHAVDDEKFDLQFFKEQRALMMEAYEAVRTIRLCLANDPAAKDVEVPEQLFKGKIWTM